MKDFFLTFIPLFVAIDVIGILPLFISLTSGRGIETRRKLSQQAVLTALLIAIAIMLAGRSIFEFLGITMSDFEIAGGLILLIISIQDLVTSKEAASHMPADPHQLGIVPLGIPLILGPAVLTTLLILIERQGFVLTFAALATNLLLVFIVFYFSNFFEKIIGRNGASAIAKVASLFLAAIAVMMIRKGLVASGLFASP